MHNTPDTFGEYVKALVKLDSLDNSRMFSTLQRGAEASFAARGLAAAPPAVAAAGGYYPPPAAAPWYAGGGGGGAGGSGFGGMMGSQAAAALAAAGIGGAAGGGGEIGTNRNPLVITHAEPSLMSQVSSRQRAESLVGPSPS